MKKLINCGSKIESNLKASLVVGCGSCEFFDIRPLAHKAALALRGREREKCLMVKRPEQQTHPSTSTTGYKYTCHLQGSYTGRQSLSAEHKYTCRGVIQVGSCRDSCRLNRERDQ